MKNHIDGIIIAFILIIVQFITIKFFPYNYKFYILISILFISILFIYLFFSSKQAIYFILFILMLIPPNAQGLFTGIEYYNASSFVNVSIVSYSVVLLFLLMLAIHPDNILAQLNRKGTTKYIVLYFIFIIIQILLSLSNIRPGGLSNKLIDNYVTPFLFFLEIVVLLNKEDIERFIKIYIFSIVCIGVFSLPEFIVKHNLFYNTYYTQNNDWYKAILLTLPYNIPYRISTTLGHPLTNASYLLLGYVFSVDLFVNTRKIRYVFSISVLFISILLTFSRAGIILALLYFIVISNIINRRSFNKTIITFFAALLIIVIVINTPYFAQLKARNLSDQSLFVRFESLKIIFYTPIQIIITGAGFNKATDIRKSFSEFSGNYENGFMIQFIESGISYLIYIYIMYDILSKYIRIKEKEKWHGTLLGGFFIIAAHIFTYNSIGDPGTISNLLWMLLAIMFISHKNIINERINAGD